MQLSGILSTIGNTPIIRLDRISKKYSFNVYAKLEFFNPTGSLKDRAALNIIKNALSTNLITANSTIVECSSGNFGLGLAMICKYLKLAFICVVDPRVTKYHLDLLKLYGATVYTVSEPDPESGEFLPALIKQVKAIIKSIPHSFWPNQHSNLDNAYAHRNTMNEIINQLTGKVDCLFCATSSCGTLRGCCDSIREKNLNIEVYAIDAEGSKIFSKSSKKRLIPGHGAGLIPGLYHADINCKPFVVSAEDSIKGCKMLLEEEAILVGGSSGGILSAIDQLKDQIKPGSNCVAILCDAGERYLDTVFSTQWAETYLNYHSQ